MASLFLRSMVGLGMALVVLTACQPSGKNVAENPALVIVDPMANKGIGPVKSITLGSLDPEKAAKGREIFNAKCSVCHKIEERYVGPALKGVTQRRSPEWIMNLILNPAEMSQKDPIVRDLLTTFLTQMTSQNVTEDEARALLEYFRQIDSGEYITRGQAGTAPPVPQVTRALRVAPELHPGPLSESKNL